MSPDSRSQISNSIRSRLASIPVERLELPIRSKNALLRSNVKTVLEVQGLIESDLLTSVRNIGPLAVEEIKECLNSLVNSIKFDPVVDQLPMFSDIENDEIVLPDNYLDDLPIDILGKELGRDMLRRLKLAQFQKFKELANLSRIVSGFIQNADTSLDRSIEFQKELLQGSIDQGQIHPQAQYRNESIKFWVNSFPKTLEAKRNLLNLLIQANGINSLTEDLISLFAGVSDRDFEIFIKYFGGNSTLESIGKQIGISRERVRQVTTKQATRLWNRVNQNPGLYLQSAILLAQDLGDQLSLQLWKQQLQEKNLMHSNSVRQGSDSFSMLCGLLRSSSKARYLPLIEVGEEINLILNSPSNLSLGLIKNIEAMHPKAKREIQRKISYVGGVHLVEASEILDVNSEQAADILEYLGYKEVTHNWYTISSGEYTTRWPVLKAGLAMMEVCQPLELNLFCDGLRRYISRFYEAIAPLEVIEAHLDVLGFDVKNDHVSWPAAPTGYLANSDKCFIEAIKKYGLVTTFQEVIEIFLDYGYSSATVTSKVLSQSPIVERVEFGLYKLRGQSHTWQNIEDAKSRQETIDYDPEVIYGTDGIIRYRVTIGTWALNGALSISANQQPLPDLGDGWRVEVDGNPCGTAKRDEYLIWGLGSAFIALAVQLGDRVELAFDAWEEPIIRISKI